MDQDDKIVNVGVHVDNPMTMDKLSSPGSGHEPGISGDTLGIPDQVPCLGLSLSTPKVHDPFTRGVQKDAPGTPDLSPCPGPSLTTLKNARSKFVRCASTPLTERGLQSLLSLNVEDFTALARGEDPEGLEDPMGYLTSALFPKDVQNTSLSDALETVPLKGLSQAICVTLDQDSGFDETLELLLSFGSKSNLESDESPISKLTIEPNTASDSGFETDLSQNESKPGSSPAILHTPRTRDIFDLKSLAKKRPSLTRCPRFAHIPGSFEGQDKVDFVTKLSEMNLSHILSTIWSCLAIEDLGRAQQVSAKWKGCINSDTHAGPRWSDARNFYFENLNFNVFNIQFKTRLLKTSPRKALGSVTNRIGTPTPIEKKDVNLANKPVNPSPNKARHKLFAEDTSIPEPKEQLNPCPRCCTASKMTPVSFQAKCTRPNCQFIFCIKCLSPDQGACPCRGVRVNRPKSCSISSKKSRDRLRRL